MPTPKKGPRLGGSPNHQRRMLANLSTELIRYGSIKTTLPKAKTLQPYFEKLVTKAKRGTVHDRRTVAKKISDRDAVFELFDIIVPDMDPERQGGYTRITKIGNRKGDNAPMAVIEIVMEPVVKKAKVTPAVEEAAEEADVLEEVEEAIEEVVEAVEESIEEAEEN